MANLLAILGADGRTTRAMLAGAALRHAARESGCKLDVDVRGPDTVSVVDTAALATAEAVVWAGLVPDAAARHANPRTLEVTLDEVLADARAVLARMIGNAPPVPKAGAQAQRIVAITSCPTGIAHTFMAAEALTQAAGALGHTIHVETQGSVGAQNTLSADAIATADLVLIAADTQVDLSRFAGKRVFRAGTKAAIHDGQALIRRAFDEASLEGAGTAQLAGPAAAAAEQQRTGPYKHLMTGVSFMLPFVVTGGILIALAFALGGIYVTDASASHTLGGVLFQIGAKSAFALMVPVLAGYIAYSIASRPGIAPGMVGGMLAASLGAGFLGGIVAGFVAGYGTEALNRWLKLPRNLEGLKPVLILPVLGCLLTGLVMLYVVGAPVAALLASLTTWLRGMQGANAVPLGALLGGMMAFDMGGPINKAAYAFSTGLIGAQVYTPMAATMAAGMTPPLGIALAAWLFPSRFTRDERQAARATAVLGLAFISEGAIPYAARDPFRVIPALVAGSACAGALSMLFGVELRVPHGGAFVLPIPNAVTHLGGYVAALVAGTVVTAVLLAVMKRRVAEAA
ncbi:MULTISPECIES: fructose-specific PTS transporter subunit EIIC [Ralstonia]|jgi:PTS system fructose-specific IIC component|uniref:protein-N(pi)-phosphohistidine--D-fructose phosphotransferase n=1 Tax=Ralstonia pickettii OR214 TaxID=1264675 RepID=R0DSM9_RALPI|nr:MULTISPECIES: fructose-specific PTS transporter subunit EIIC [Ralstonia]MEA3271374.1 fructose-specific PTS transporter subunit EIIC [Pseudomonadota bacterium]ENZ76518.1 PTS system D-fructose-specific IIC component (F1P-forming) [Ralstonia pickettii OR214]MBL4779608.1 PTS fructose transporter subunit EIIBC [Ralstonia sp.]MCM3578873.1 fructose-specific PTS transporter subunit EIIC [Ralstonia pickettii]MDR9384722.1 fructose-specific PTS transporter subunit EIIC [Ralstonia sp. 11b]